MNYNIEYNKDEIALTLDIGEVDPQTIIRGIRNIDIVRMFEPIALSDRGVNKEEGKIKIYLPSRDDLRQGLKTYTIKVARIIDTTTWFNLKTNRRLDISQLINNLIPNVVEEINYFLSYIFKVLHLNLNNFNFTDFFEHRESMIDEEKSRVKIKFTKNYIHFHKFKYSKEQRKEIMEKLEEIDINNDLYIQLSPLLDMENINFKVDIENALLYKDKIINCIREYELEKV